MSKQNDPYIHHNVLSLGQHALRQGTLGEPVRELRVSGMAHHDDGPARLRTARVPDTLRWCLRVARGNFGVQTEGRNDKRTLDNGHNEECGDAAAMVDEALYRRNDISDDISNDISEYISEYIALYISLYISDDMADDHDHYNNNPVRYVNYDDHNDDNSDRDDDDHNDDDPDNGRDDDRHREHDMVFLGGRS